MIDRRLKVRHLQAFVEIARQKSLKRAAEILNLTQPAISKTLKELEQITGVTLLERSRGGVAMTIEGDVFLRYANSSLTAIDQAMTSVSAISKGEEGRVAVGALPSVAARMLPRAVELFARLAPNATPLIEDGPHGFLVDRLRAGRLDLVIGRLGKPDTMKDISFTQLYAEDVVIVCAPGHPLAGARALADIGRYPVIYPPQEAAIRPLVDRMMIANGVGDFPQRIESVSATFGRGLTLGGDALWIISTGVVADDIAAGRLIALPIKTELTAGPIGIMARAEDDLSPLAQMFRQAAIRAVGDLGLS
ncbi:HTH-type transcriptional regulator GbpR [Roseovarius gaetbuli]|uniref:HTH-type transcriptional regulator GbpR n=1 Tax=Roseovarius gaetbuli TaxID=1356575 RepID=A0A1X6Z852_9RHOB|nr:pca operon transcription factor PcaQ [Roseovarius gaetbuli]SLN43191.1 HTH-type transcriptional regulator GbpR [Roseovarius gaetbuli]